MLTYWMDLSDPFRAFDVLRRRMDLVEPRVRATSVRASLRDTKDAFVLSMEVPGLTEKDLELSATAESLTVTGERKASAPEGYTSHRRERSDVRFSRSFALPARIVVEGVSAEVKHGLLTITLPKHPDVTPRSITIKTAA